MKEPSVVPSLRSVGVTPLSSLYTGWLIRFVILCDNLQYIFENVTIQISVNRGLAVAHIKPDELKLQYPSVGCSSKSSDAHFMEKEKKGISSPMETNY